MDAFLSNTSVQITALLISFCAWALSARFQKANNPILTATAYFFQFFPVLFIGRHWGQAGTFLDLSQMDVRFLEPHIPSIVFFGFLAGAFYLTGYKFPRVVRDRRFTNALATVAFVFAIGNGVLYGEHKGWFKVHDKETKSVASVKEGQKLDFTKPLQEYKAQRQKQNK